MDDETTSASIIGAVAEPRHPDDHRYAWPRADIGADRFRWPRRIFFALALLGAGAYLIYAFGRAPNNEVAQHLDPAIVRQQPLPGSHVLHQAQIGVVLRQGFDGRMTIDGIDVPEDEMDGAIPSTSPLFDPRLGPRPNGKNEVLFTPGAGKSIDSYHAGEVTITVRYWRISDGEGAARTVSWKFSVN